MKRFSALAAVVLLAASCDSTVQEPLVEQQQPVNAGPMVVMDLTGNFYTLPAAKSYPIGTSVSAKIDDDGGSVAMGDFAILKVPEDAVDRTTVFTITVVKNGYVELDLSAMQYKDGRFVEVGGLGFKKSVYLFVNTDYANLNTLSRTDGGNLTMLWEINGTLSGTFSATTSWVSGGWVVSRLDHFSEYVMASN